MDNDHGLHSKMERVQKLIQKIIHVFFSVVQAPMTIAIATFNKVMEIFQHPGQVCMTYMEHWWLSMEMAVYFAYGAVCAVIHAFFPDILVTSTTDTLKYCNDRVANAGCRDEFMRKIAHGGLEKNSAGHGKKDSKTE